MGKKREKRNRLKEDVINNEDIKQSSARKTALKSNVDIVDGSNRSQMKKLLHKRFIILNSITKEESFKVVYIFSIILALYGSYVLASGTKTMIESTLVTFTFPIFNLLFFLLVLLNSYNTYKSFSKEFDSYIIRLKTKRDYYNIIVKFII